MAEYIEREAAVNALTSIAVQVSDSKVRTVAKCINAVELLPAADVAPVRHGEWILGHVEPGYFTPGGNRPWICSKCGQVVSWSLARPEYNYCPNCGAKMDGGENNDKP